MVGHDAGAGGGARCVVGGVVVRLSRIMLYFLPKILFSDSHKNPLLFFYNV